MALASLESRPGQASAASEDGSGGLSANYGSVSPLARLVAARATQSALRKVDDFKLTAIVVFSRRRARIVPTSQPDGSSC